MPCGASWSSAWMKAISGNICGWGISISQTPRTKMFLNMEEYDESSLLRDPKILLQNSTKFFIRIT
jgi:hypothetical protein